MNAKNKLIEKLLRVAKKHKILTYPVLALVAFISFFGNLFTMRNGAGKRVIAIVMVMVMFVSQSCFLTSSATALVDDEDAALVQAKLQQESVSAEEDFSKEKVTQTATTESSSEKAATTEETTALEDAGEEEQTVNDVAGVPSAETIEETASDVTDVTEVVDADDVTVVDDEEESIDSRLDIDSDKIEVNIAFNYSSTNNAGGTDGILCSDNLKISGVDNGAKTVDLSGEAYIGHARNEITNFNNKDGMYRLVDEWYTEVDLLNQITDFTKVPIVYANGSYTAVLYCKQELNQYQVTIANTKVEGYDSTYFSNDPEYTVSGTIKDDANLTTYNVKVTADSNPKEATFSLSNIMRYGYTLVRVDVDTQAGDSVTSFTGSSDTVGGSATITLKGDSKDKKVTLVWEPNIYYFDYYDYKGNIISTESDSWSSARFDNTSNVFWVGDTTVGHETGYVHTGNWTVGTVGSDKVANGDTSVTTKANPNPYYPGKGGHVSLYPEFEYVGIMLNGEKDKETFEDNEMSYKSSASSGTFSASFKNSKAGTGTFKYEIADGSSINNLSDTDLNGYGLKFVSNSNGFHFEPSDGVSPTKAGTASIVVKVTDTSRTDDSVEKSQTFTIKLNIKKCKIEAKASGLTTEKLYDASNTAPCATTSSSKTKLKTSDEDVEVECELNGAHYNSVNVVEADKILFVSYELKYADSSVQGKASDNYELTSVDVTTGCCYIPGKINPVEVKVKPSVDLGENADIGYIRTGEADPTYTFTIAENQNLSEELKAKIPNNWLDHIEYTTTRTDLFDLYTVRHDFKINTFKIVTDSDSIASGNFSPDMSGTDINAATFEVKQETPDNYYYIDGNKLTGNEWYNGKQAVSIKAVQGSVYDTVQISTKGKDGPFENIETATEDLSNNANVYIRLYSSRTNAVTSAVQLGLLYDPTAPEYKGYSFTQTGEDGTSLDFDTAKFNGDYSGLYFPGIGGVMSFGTYTKSTIQIKVAYEDKTSGLKSLHYTFGTSQTEQEVDFVKDGTTGYAVIELLAGAVSQIGTIKCCAEDSAGNTSNWLTLSPTLNNDTYEWSVEQVVPKIDSFAVKYRVGLEKDNHFESVYSGREWYNHCYAELKVSDATAGLRQVEWYVNGKKVDEEEYASSKTTESDLLKLSIDPETYASEDSTYSVQAKIYDNAGNVISTDEISFKIDDVKPTLEVDYKDSVYISDTTISFKVKDEGGSGLDYVRVQNADGETIDCKLEKQGEDGWYDSSFEASAKGNYTITAVDHAGNVEVWTKDIQKISKQQPVCPDKIFDPETPDGAYGWYVTRPTITITNQKQTEDGTPVTTQYQMWLEGETPLVVGTVSGDSEEVEIPGEGIYNVKAWSVSASSISCDTANDQVQIKVDTKAPEITFTTSKGSGSSIKVDFTVTDAGSGVDLDTVQVVRGAEQQQSYDFEMTETEDGCTGSFEITEIGNYYIKAADIAGNVSEDEAFTPMSMKVKAVTNISSNSATIGANVIKGTFDIASASIAYRKVADTDYTEAQSVLTEDENGNVAVSAVLGDLTENTSYVFKITAVSDASSELSTGEVLEYEGYFKTLASSNSGISVKGTAKYATSTEGEITVGLYEGNVCVMATEISAGEEFTFNNVPDGNYSIVATDGTYSTTKRLLIEDGIITYPTSYIDLVLSGKNTSVVITTSDTPNVTVDNMDYIFTNDSVNFTDEDQLIVSAGGTVEFRLLVTIMSVNSASADYSAIMAAIDSNKVIGKCIDLTMLKIVTYADGTVMPSEQVTSIAPKISVTVPLGDLAGKPGLQVIRVHDGSGTPLGDEDSNPSTYTFSTNLFSTYAIVYTQETEVATTTEQQTGPITTGSVVLDGTATPSQSGAVYAKNTTTKEDPDADDDDDDGDDDADNSNDSTNGSSASTTTASVGSLRSSGTAKTGDVTPIAALGTVMLVSMAGFFLLIRKNKTGNN